jgi:hypothetical protein
MADPNQNETKTSLTGPGFITLLLGALISLISSAVTIGIQSHYEHAAKKQQFFMEQRVAALKEFSNTISSGQNIIEKYDSSDRMMADLLADAKSALTDPQKKELRALVELDRGIEHDRERFAATVRAQIPFLNSLFEEKFPNDSFQTPKPVSVESIEDLSSSELSRRLMDDLSHLKPEMNEARNTLVRQLNLLQNFVEELATKIGTD